MKRKDLMTLNSVLNSFNDSYPVKFSYFLSKNKKVVEDEISSIRSCAPSFPEEYQKRREDLIREHAEKDENGNIIFEDQKTGMPKYSDVNKITEEINKLAEEFKPQIEEFESKQKEFEDFLNEEVELRFHMIPMNLLPENLILSVKDMEVFNQLIIE